MTELKVVPGWKCVQFPIKTTLHFRHGHRRFSENLRKPCSVNSMFIDFYFILRFFNAYTIFLMISYRTHERPGYYAQRMRRVHCTHFHVLHLLRSYIREVLHVEIRNFFDRLICRNSQSRISANERFCKQKIRFPSVAKQRKNGDVRFCQAETAEIWLRNIFFFIKTTSVDHGAYGGQRRTRPPCCSSLVVPWWGWYRPWWISATVEVLEAGIGDCDIF